MLNTIVMVIKWCIIGNVYISVDLARGDYLSAGLDAIGVIPFIGEFADVAKTGKKIGNAVGLTKAAAGLDDTIDAVRAVRNAKNTGKAISPQSLVKTHRLTLSKKKYFELLKDISDNGIKEPIKYVEYGGTKYIVDGHHRHQADIDLKLRNIPVKKVNLPYKGYNTVDDLLWFD